MKNIEILRCNLARTEQVLKESAGRRTAYTELGMIAQANREQEMIEACAADLDMFRKDLAGYEARVSARIEELMPRSFSGNLVTVEDFELAEIRRQAEADVNEALVSSAT